MKCRPMAMDIPWAARNCRDPAKQIVNVLLRAHAMPEHILDSGAHPNNHRPDRQLAASHHISSAGVGNRVARGNNRPLDLHFGSS
jgi:hypothetical protein